MSTLISNRTAAEFTVTKEEPVWKQKSTVQRRSQFAASLTHLRSWQRVSSRPSSKLIYPPSFYIFQADVFETFPTKTHPVLVPSIWAVYPSLRRFRALNILKVSSDLIVSQSSWLFNILTANLLSPSCTQILTEHLFLKHSNGLIMITSDGTNLSTTAMYGYENGDNVLLSFGAV